MVETGKQSPYNTKVDPKTQTLIRSDTDVMPDRDRRVVLYSASWNKTKSDSLPLQRRNISGARGGHEHLKVFVKGQRRAASPVDRILRLPTDFEVLSTRPLAPSEMEAISAVSPASEIRSTKKRRQAGGCRSAVGQISGVPVGSNAHKFRPNCSGKGVFSVNVGRR